MSRSSQLVRIQAQNPAKVVKNVELIAVIANQAANAIRHAADALANWGDVQGRRSPGEETIMLTQQPSELPPNTYWVDPHKLLAGEYPGSKDPGKAREKIRHFLEAGVRHFIDLTELRELTKLGELVPYEAILSEESRARNVITTYQRIPIRDESVPKEPKTMAAITAAIAGGMAEGGITYVHCWGGVGRTGLAVACWLQERGLTPDEALRDLADKWRSCAKSKRRPRSPETAEQVRWVKKWPLYRSTVKISK